MKNPFRNKSTALFISLLSLIGFLFVAFLRSTLAPTDSAVNSWTASIHTSSLTIISEAIATLFDITILLPLSLLVAVILYLRHHHKHAVLWLAAMGGVTLIVETTKTLIQSPRPFNGIVVETGYSFPSGHVTSTMVLLGLLTYFAWQHWKTPRTKTLATLLYIATESLVGFSRVYLNVHWLSDILGGYLLGTFWLTLTIFLYEYSENKWPIKTQD